MSVGQRINGPIPGENYTSDTRNYPWHRPPDTTTIDQGIDFAYQQILDPDNVHGLLAMLHMGIDIATLTDIFLTGGISSGKWTVDIALLMAGPVSHIIYLVAKGSGINPNLGIDSPKPMITKSYIDAVKMDNKTFNNAKKAMDDPEVRNQIADELDKVSGGMMGMKDLPPISQSATISGQNKVDPADLQGGFMSMNQNSGAQ